MAPLTSRQLVAFAVEGPDVAVRGVVDGRLAGSLGLTSSGPPPVLVTHRPGAPPLRVWVDGALLRVEHDDGRPLVLADADSVWNFDDERGGQDLPSQAPRSALQLIGPTGTVLRRLSAADVLSGRFSRPVGPPRAVVVGGREAWAQHFAEPSLPPRPRRRADPVVEAAGEVDLVLDAETGWPLRIESPSGWARWEEFTVGSALTSSRATWTGPVRPRPVDPPDDHDGYRAREAARHAAGAEWFAAEIGLGRSARTEVGFSLAVASVQEVDRATGAVQATLDVVLGNRAPVVLQVVRWPRGTAVEADDWRASATRWSTQRYEWAAEWGFRDLGPDALQAVAALFSEDPEVVR